MTVPADDQVPRKPLSTREDYRSLLTGEVALIDVRAPLEFEKGAFAAATNLPLLSDEERHLVGIRYKEAGQDEAIELGAALLGATVRAERVQAWKAFASVNPNGALYCFRGGLRSRITQAWLAAAGVEWPLVTGGYKALRSFSLESLDRLSQNLPLALVAGRTGSGKTDLLLRLERHVDLEGRANHRGSSFGGMASDQPTPVNFENAIAIDFLRLEDSCALAPVWLEDEAKLIGRICLPQSLRKAMLRAPAVILETPLDERISNCTRDYVVDLLARYQSTMGEQKGFDAFASHHRRSLDRIKKRFGGERHSQALELLDKALDAHREHADTSAYGDFIELLLTDYYDPMYDYQLLSKERSTLATGDAETLLAFANDYSDGPGVAPRVSI